MTSNPSYFSFLRANLSLSVLLAPLFLAILTASLSAQCAGDFDGDGLYGALDINLLMDDLCTGANNLAFDLDASGTVDLNDRDLWLCCAGEVNLGPGCCYQLGDVDLSGCVDAFDFAIWNANKFTTNSAWSSGNFNGDCEIDNLDEASINANLGTCASCVPEPSSLALVIFGLVGLTLHRRQRT